jgi:hypothetical protein
MKKIILLIFVALMFSGCGRSTVDSELIGQVKKVQNHTPLLCPNYYTADVSLGIMQNGVGSYSTQDIWVTVEQKDVPAFQQAVESGRPVKVHYDTWRIALCTEDQWATSLEFLQ